MTLATPLAPARKTPTLSVRATPGVAPPGWDCRVAAAGGNVFHSAAYGRVIAGSGKEPWFLELLEGDTPVGFAVAGGARSRLPVFGVWRSQLALNTTPLLRDGLDLREAMQAIMAFARRERFGRLDCSAFASPNPEATRTLEDLDFSLRPRLEFRVPLQDSLERMMTDMSSQHRRNLRKAMSQGFTLREDSTMDGALLLRRLQNATYGRRWQLGHTHARPMPWGAYRQLMESWLETGSIRFWFVERNGKALSALGILTFGERAYYLVGGTGIEGYRVNAPFAAFGHVIEALYDAGVTELHLGGVPADAHRPDSPDHGLYRFKRGFGGSTVTCWDAHRTL